MSLFGPIGCKRAYYYCGRCGRGLFPWDTIVGLTPKRLTPAAEEIVSLAGALSQSFEEAADKLLPKMTGIRLAETTVNGQRKRLANGWEGSCRPDVCWVPVGIGPGTRTLTAAGVLT